MWGYNLLRCSLDSTLNANLCTRKLCTIDYILRSSVWYCSTAIQTSFCAVPKQDEIWIHPNTVETITASVTLKYVQSEEQWLKRTVVMPLILYLLQVPSSLRKLVVVLANFSEYLLYLKSCFEVDPNDSLLQPWNLSSSSPAIHFSVHDEKKLYFSPSIMCPKYCSFHLWWFHLFLFTCPSEFDVCNFFIGLRFKGVESSHCL